MGSMLNAHIKQQGWCTVCHILGLPTVAGALRNFKSADDWGPWGRKITQGINQTGKKRYGHCPCDTPSIFQPAAPVCPSKHSKLTKRYGKYQEWRSCPENTMDFHSFLCFLEINSPIPSHSLGAAADRLPTLQRQRAKE